MGIAGIGKGWDVLDAGPLEGALPRVIARRDRDVLSLGAYPDHLKERHPEFYDHCESAEFTATIEGLDEVRERGIFLNGKCVGYYIYVTKATSLVMGITFMILGPNVNLRDKGIGAAVLMDAVHQMHRVGGHVTLFQVINPRAFRNILVREGYGHATAHLQANPVFAGASGSRSLLESRVVAVQDLEVNPSQYDLFSLPEILNKIVIAR